MMNQSSVELVQSALQSLDGKQMKTFNIVLRGSHGGELYSMLVVVNEGSDIDEFLTESMEYFVRDCIIHPGDTITIEEVND